MTVRMERRTSPRIEVVDQVHAQIVPFSAVIRLKDLGPDGFCIESCVSFPVGARYHFRFITAAGARVLVDAAVVYSRASNFSVGFESHVAGFAFLHTSARTADSIHILLDAVLAPLELGAPTL